MTRPLRPNLAAARRVVAELRRDHEANRATLAMGTLAVTLAAALDDAFNNGPAYVAARYASTYAGVLGLLRELTSSKTDAFDAFLKEIGTPSGGGSGEARWPGPFG